jgi:hypothetical protein
MMNRSFMTAAEQREKEKDPNVRYQRFVRATHTGLHPHAKNSVTKRAGPLGKHAPPAWLFKPDAVSSGNS